MKYSTQIKRLNGGYEHPKVWVRFKRQMDKPVANGFHIKSRMKRRYYRNYGQSMIGRMKWAIERRVMPF